MTVFAAFMGLLLIMWSTGKRIAPPWGWSRHQLPVELLVYPAIYCLGKKCSLPAPVPAEA